MLRKRPDIEEKRIKPNVIRRRTVRSGVEEISSISPDQISAENHSKTSLGLCVGENEKRFCMEGGNAKMKMNEVKKIAITWGVDARPGRSKRDIIRDIQVREGYSPCFGTKEACDEDCLWKADCIGEKRDRKKGVSDKA